MAATPIGNAKTRQLNSYVVENTPEQPLTTYWGTKMDVSTVVLALFPYTRSRSGFIPAEFVPPVFSYCLCRKPRGASKLANEDRRS